MTVAASVTLINARGIRSVCIVRTPSLMDRIFTLYLQSHSKMAKPNTNFRDVPKLFLDLKAFDDHLACRRAAWALRARDPAP
jgi:hypothetical protein